MNKQQGSILVIGAAGQIGTELTLALRQKYGENNVVASDMVAAHAQVLETGPYEHLNILDKSEFEAVLERHKPSQIYHLAAILSARGEQNPQLAWQINLGGTQMVLEAARHNKYIKKVFIPSTIAVFGPNTPRQHTPQHTIMEPKTIYGISKLAGERLCDYYHSRYQIDVRGLRYPGIVSHKALPGGGTTDYAVEIFHHALSSSHSYNCFLAADTCLPMMYMADALRATIELMDAEQNQISVRSAYNLAAISFTPQQLAAQIKCHIPDFKISYQPDFRQQIASGWPLSIDDSIARADWNWKHTYNLEAMVEDMILNLKNKISIING